MMSRDVWPLFTAESHPHHRSQPPTGRVQARTGFESPPVLMSTTNSETSRREWAEVVFSMLLVAAVFVVLPTMGVTVPQEAKITAGLASTYIFGDGASDLYRSARSARSTDETTNDDRV